MVFGDYRSAASAGQGRERLATVRQPPRAIRGLSSIAARDTVSTFACKSVISTLIGLRQAGFAPCRRPTLLRLQRPSAGATLASVFGANPRLSIRSLTMRAIIAVLIGCVSALETMAVRAADNTPPEGFAALFNGKDLTGWKGLWSPIHRKRAKMTPEELAKAQKEADDEHAGPLEGRGRRARLRRQGAEPLHGQGLRRLRDCTSTGRSCPRATAASISAARPQVQIWDRNPDRLRRPLQQPEEPHASRRRWPTSRSASGTRSASRWSATR